MNDEDADYAGTAKPRRVRRPLNPGWSESAKERTERYRREEEEWAAKNGPVIIKRKANE